MGLDRVLEALLVFEQGPYGERDGCLAALLHLDARVAEGSRHPCGVQGDDGHPEMHAFQQGHTKPLMLAQTDKDIGQTVIGYEFTQVNVAGKDECLLPSFPP